MMVLGTPISYVLKVKWRTVSEVTLMMKLMICLGTEKENYVQDMLMITI